MFVFWGLLFKLFTMWVLPCVKDNPKVIRRMKLLHAEYDKTFKDMKMEITQEEIVHS